MWAHPAVSFAPSDIGRPLPEDGGIDERLAPESARDPGIALAQIAQALVLDEPHLARRDRAQAGVQDFQVQALKVGNIAGDVEGRDLAPALPRDLVGAGEALQERARPGGTVPLPHDVLVRPEVHDLHGQICERVPLAVGEGGDALQLADERMGRGSPSFGQDGAPLFQAGAHGSLSHQRPLMFLIVLMIEELSHINEFPSLIYVNLRHSYPIHELSPRRKRADRNVSSPRWLAALAALRGEAKGRRRAVPVPNQSPGVRIREECAARLH